MLKRYKKYIIAVSLIASLYGVVATTNATKIEDYDNKDKQPVIVKSSDDWIEQTSVLTEERVKEQIIDTSVSATVREMDTDLNVRADALLDSQVVGSLHSGAPVKILESADGWAKINFPQVPAGYGYVSEIYLQKDNSYGSIDVFK